VRLVFLGTPDFAVPALDALAESTHEILLVVSQPDRARGRGRQPQPTPVRRRAIERGLEETTLQRGGRRILYERILGLEPEIVVVVAFGHILREPLLNGPRHGCLNLHASLLPRWRGPAPIHRAILAGDEKTGVCTMRLEEGVDTGPLYRCAATPIGRDETAGQLHDRLARMGAELLLETLDTIEREGLQPHPQPEDGACYAPLLKKEEGTVDFDRPAPQVHDRIRGLDPWPGVTVESTVGLLRLAQSRLAGSRVPGAASPEGGGSRPGEILAVDGEGMWVACAEGSVRIGRVQAPGSRWMHPEEFVRGHPLPPGSRLLPLAEVPPRVVP